MTSGDRDEYGDYSVDESDQLEPGDTLDDNDVKDVLDRGYSPPERYSAGQRWGNTAWEAEHREPLSLRLSEEEPDVDPYADDDPRDDGEDSYDDGQDEGECPREVGGRRAGRLVDPDEGLSEDREKDLYGSDVGIDGAAASAEEAAVHVIDDEADLEDD